MSFRHLFSEGVIWRENVEQPKRGLQSNVHGWIETNRLSYPLLIAVIGRLQIDPDHMSVICEHARLGYPRAPGMKLSIDIL